MPDHLDTSVSCFVVKIWGGKEDIYQLLIEWKVCLDGLKYLGQQIHARNQNEIIFGLNDGYYGAPFEHKGYSNAQKNILQVDQNCVRNSYDVFSLLRLHRAQCAIKQTQVTVQKIGKEIEEKLRLKSTSNELKKESECLQLKILVLQNELERQKKALGQEVALLHKQQIALQDKGSTFSTEHLKLQLQKEALNELRKECTAKRELFLKTNAQLTIRCRQLLSELSYIYPIDLQPTDILIFIISEKQLIKSSAMVYPNLYNQQHIKIKHNLDTDHRWFPLYPKGGEKLQFDYGVYLLNKNIAQISLATGFAHKSLPHKFPEAVLPVFTNFCLGLTAPLLSPVMDTSSLKYRSGDAGNDRHHTSSAIPVPKRQSSMFGGADVGFSGGIPSPDKGHRKRASSENERLQYKTPPPSYNCTLVQPVTTIPSVGESERKTASLSSSLDTSLDFSKENQKKGVDFDDSLNDSHVSVNTSQTSGEALSRHPAAVNGTLLPGEQAGSASVQLPSELRPASGAELCCTVEQAEEIIGLEATGFTTGDQLEAFNCIPVDSAVAVECDEQVLGEFEEFSRRIYALNENVSSFRRPRRSSDK
ncbi:UV radiation resistance-associated gene protein [Fukomys damarensis]|uniref:UV radiation resistance-associated gene protein n=1 Tax=Fukomys damarensis TaxID=885580 RepID=A0A091E729_FUKDA|nr:UV radiation resistance-associated gene protein [Fukomys damarensis]